MEVCLVRCPSAFLIDEKAFPPLGLMAVGAGLRLQGHNVELFDGDIEQLPLDFKYYGFGPTTPEYPHALDCLQRIKEHNPRARVIVGGPHVTLSYTKCQKDGWDCIVVGDGEIVAEQAFSLKSTTRIIFAQERPLDEYPIPDRSLIDLHNYNFRLQGRLTTTIMGSRGCPHRCAFCCKNYKSVRLTSAPYMIREIDLLYNQFGVRALAFPEDIFILNKSKAEAVCSHLKSRGIIWRCLVRADLVVKYGLDFLKMMVDSGCIGVGIGIESGSDKVLAKVNKGETVDQMFEAIHMLKHAGIYTKGFFILGLPGESEETLQETALFLQLAQMDDIDCKIYRPYPGSPIYNHKEEYDIEWEETLEEYTFYKGRPGEYYGDLQTSSLSTEQIVEAWKHFEKEYKDWSHLDCGPANSNLLHRS